MEDGEPTSDGLVASAKRLGSSFLGLLQTRIELLAVELQEEKVRALDLLALMTAAIAFAVGAILLAIGTLAWFLWQQAGYVGLIGLTLATAIAAVAMFIIMRRRIVRGRQPFSATTAEFRKDVEWLRRN
jgi:uncharacterized membrane protein YqjE